MGKGKEKRMSIILKGIDMPKDIDELRLIINGMSIAIEPTKAIQIPTPHGRLIDADAFVKDFTQNYEECRDVGYFSSEESETIAGVVASGVALDVYNAPTILEAEEE